VSTPGSGPRGPDEGGEPANGSNGRPGAVPGRELLDADQTASDADQTASDADQTASGHDQTLADAEQGLAESDQRQANIDQDASERDQAAANREFAANPGGSSGFKATYAASRTDREETTLDRDRATRARAETGVERMSRGATRDQVAKERDLSAVARDEAAEIRDAAAEERDQEAAEQGLLLEAYLSPRDRKLHDAALRHAAATGESAALLRDRAVAERSRAAADRERARADRERAARDREQAARDREEAQTELRFAHLDELTGAYRRGMGRVAIQQEIDRARRGDGRLLLAYLDVTGLKRVNDEAGHAAGDEVLRTVAGVLRSSLRSYEPLVRLGGDEFAFTLAGMDVFDADTRLVGIRTAVSRALHPDAIRVGVSYLCPGDTMDELIGRADAALVAAR
jgi:diguanylate cyclase (GGDEF)-like protein